MSAAPRPFLVGITGGIASGKSTVARLFADLGVTVIDADQLAREAVAAGSDGLAAIVAAFGTTVLDAAGSLDRAAMRRLVFADDQARARLEQIVHPRVRALLAGRVAAADGPYCMVEIPLRVEAGWQGRLERVLVVDVDEAEQVARACARSDLTDREVRAIMRTQATREQRLKAADDIIVNHADREALVVQVRELHEKYLVLAREKHG